MTESASARSRWVGVVAATIVAALTFLVLAEQAYADHRPDGITVQPHPTVPVPNPGTQAGGASAQLALPPTLPDEPDLIPIMLTESALNTPGLPAIFMDTYQIPGRVLYRFDAVLGNIGGALDLFCQNCDSSPVISQAIWSGGDPGGDQNASLPPVGSENRSLNERGANMVYSNAFGHWHWHIDEIALYELLVPGQEAVPTAKIGFCMFDTYDNASNPNRYGSGSPWCKPGQPFSIFVRMGISPGLGDYYNAQLEDQWIDVTGLPAGTYTLRAE
ncbi:MAG: lysyl oxidase family protein, partial [Gaiellaceae bacterium]